MTGGMMLHPTVSTASSRELLLELKRHHHGHNNNNNSNCTSSGSTALPPYNLKLVRESLQDIQWHLKEAELEIQAATASASATADANANADTDKDLGKRPDRFAPKPSILLHDSIVRRHKRCLLAYHIHRAQALQRQVVLESSSSAASSTRPTSSTNSAAFSHLTQNAPELDFCQAYHQLQSRYWQTVLPDMGMTSSSTTRLVPPPSATGNVQVRCLLDQGPVVLESGRSITLTKGSVLYLPKADVWEWIYNGTLQILEGEEVDF